MALLNDLPKYGFSTAFSVTFSEKGSANGEEDSCVGDTNNISNNVNPKISETTFVDMIHLAMRLGCRHFDCAPQYSNQKLVGSTLRKLLRSSGIARGDVFITSRLPVSQMKSGDMIEKSFRSTLAELQLTYLDLFVVQSPGSTGGGIHYGNDNECWPRDAEGNLQLDDAEELLVAAWQKLVDLKRTGQIRYIGACNVTIKQLDRLNKIHSLDVVQNEYHLYSQDRELFDYCEEVDVHYEALVTVASNQSKSTGNTAANNTNGSSANIPLSNNCDNKKLTVVTESNSPNTKLSAAVRSADPVIDRIATENKLSRSQILIEWLHRQPLSYVILAKSPEQLEENIKATTKISLSVNDLIDLDCLSQGARPQLASQNT